YDLVKILDALPDLFPSRQQAVKFGLYQFHNRRDGARRPSKRNGIGSQLCCHVHRLSTRSTEHSTTSGQKLESRDEPLASVYGCIFPKSRDATGELEPI